MKPAGKSMTPPQASHELSIQIVTVSPPSSSCMRHRGNGCLWCTKIHCVWLPAHSVLTNHLPSHIISWRWWLERPLFLFLCSSPSSTSPSFLGLPPGCWISSSFPVRVSLPQCELCDRFRARRTGGWRSQVFHCVTHNQISKWTHNYREIFLLLKKKIP